MKRTRLKLIGSLLLTLTPSGMSYAQADKTKPDDGKRQKEEQRAEITSKEEANFSIDKLVGGKEVWAQTADQIEKDYSKGGYKWLETGKKDRGILRPNWMWMKSERKNSKGQVTLNLSGARTSYQLFDGAASAEEVNFDFRDGKLLLVTMSIWNKGDSEEITKPAFMSKVTVLTDLLNGRLGVRVKDIGKDQANASKALRLRWEGAETVAQLEYSFTEELVSHGAKRERVFIPEFIRLRLMPKGESAVGAVNAPNVAKVSASALAGRVKKLPNGDVYIDGVPMVDQGEKGYCAVASSERVMRYYGIQCDQHDLAQAAAASAGGTRPGDFEDALHKLQGKFKIRVRDLVKFDYQDHLRLLKAYNKEAASKKGKIWREQDWYFEPDLAIYRDARCRNNAYEKFQKLVVDSTSRGVPLLWALRLGIYPENGEKARQSGGGHMRTIIGYNIKADEIIFSDSWGAGHEMKRIKGRDAWAATLGLYLVEPQN